MKKKLLAFCLAGLISLPALACDICGCGAGNSYIGILPDFHKHIVGLRYRYNSMLTHVGTGSNYTHLTTEEKFNTLEAWGGWNLSNKLRVMASVPYSFNQRTNGGATTSKSGVGDITVSGFYGLLNKRATVGSKLLVQSLWFGGGVKLATGKYSPEDKGNGSNNANLFQLGTGSTDFTLGLMYDIRLQDGGLNLASNYKINTQNKYDYQYGNKFNVNAQAYYKFRIKDMVTVAPNAGVQYEGSKEDLDKGFSVTASGGNLLLGTVGMEALFSKIALGANIQTPLSQNLASGIVKANNRFMVHMAFAL